MNTIAEQLKDVLDRIRQAEQRSGRPAGAINLVAVSKTFPAEDVQECYQAGQRIFGENKVQEMLSKIPALPADAQWHLIGPLQRNKVRKVVGKSALIHSVDSLRLATYIDSVAQEFGVCQPILLEVHIGGEDSKFGFSPDELKVAWGALLELGHLDIRGLMCIPPPVDDPNDARPFFQQLRSLRDELNEQSPHTIHELSMGMSHDFEIAVEEGATMVRVGTSIFGHRDYSNKA